MYYVNQEQIQSRLQFISYLQNAAELLSQEQDDGPVAALARERLLHLSIETATDIGSLMIDGFVMRDASSYEDIIEVLKDEEVFDAGLAARLTALVKLRKSLVQHYTKWDRSRPHPLLDELGDILKGFAEAVALYLQHNL